MAKRPETRCPSCGLRRGRRACPALGRVICSACCGKKRLTEIACPPGCVYLAGAHQHPPAVVQRRHEREGRFLAGVVQGLSEDQYRLFLFLQVGIARHAPGSIPGLLDSDVADAARALADTAATAASGIIYEHQAGSAPGQRLAAALTASLEPLRQAGRGLRDGDLALALRATERAAREAAAALGGERAYVELVRDLFTPAPSDEADPMTPETSRLILP